MGTGLALSGGGFRATLFHLGVIAYLRDVGRLSEITHITSVSGGSITAAHLVLNWERYNGDEKAFAAVAAEIINFIKLDVRGRILRRIPIYFPFYWFSVLLRRMPLVDENSLGWWTRVSTTDLLRRYYSHKLFGKKRLTHLKGSAENPRPKLFLLTTNIEDAQQASFTSRGFQIGNTSYDCPLKDLGLAVAASSAFPGMFPSVVFQPKRGKNPTFRLIDGGVFDNLGVRKFWDLMTVEKIPFEEIIVSDASVAFKPASRSSFFEPFTTPFRAADILFKRVYDFERRMAEEADKDIRDCTFRFLRLLDKLDSETDDLALFSEYQDEVYSIRTDLDAFSDVEIAALVRHGYSVARAKLTSKPPAVLGTLPWDPVPSTRSHLAKALTARDHDRSDHILKHLGRSSARRFRFVSTRDWASYLTSSLLLLIVAFLAAPYIMRVPYVSNLISSNYPLGLELIQATEQVLDSKISEAAKQYQKVLWDRKVNGRRPNAFAADTNAVLPVDTWSTSQATYALLRMKNHTPDQFRFLAGALEARFQPSAADWVGAVGGWHTRPGTHHLQAEPAIWTLTSLSRILQDEEFLDAESRSRLTSRVHEVQTYLTANKFYVWEGDQLAFNVLANQKDLQSHSAYTTSLALLALVEMRRAGLKWDRTEPDAMIAGVLKWLNAHYDDKKKGWNSVDGDTEVDTQDEAVNMQILAIMLETYADLQLEQPAEFRSRVSDHLTLLGNSTPVDSEARVYLSSDRPADEAFDNEIRIRFLGKPWAIRFCREWLRTTSSTATPEEKAKVLILMQKLSSGIDDSLRIDRDALTYRSAEMLLALS